MCLDFNFSVGFDFWWVNGIKREIYIEDGKRLFFLSVIFLSNSKSEETMSSV